MQNFNIRQAAIWAENKGILYTVNTYNNEPQHMYAICDATTHMVECLGSLAKCQSYLQAQGCQHDRMPTPDGRWLRLVCLHDVICGMEEA